MKNHIAGKAVVGQNGPLCGYTEGLVHYPQSKTAAVGQILGPAGWPTCGRCTRIAKTRGIEPFRAGAIEERGD